MCSDAERLNDAGHKASAYVGAWAALEASMRNVRNRKELSAREMPTELIRILYAVGVLSREEFLLLRDSFSIRTQVVHGMVIDPANFERIPIGRLIEIARRLLTYENATDAK